MIETILTNKVSRGKLSKTFILDEYLYIPLEQLLEFYNCKIPNEYEYTGRCIINKDGSIYPELTERISNGQCTK